MKNIKTWAISVLALTICGLVAFSAIIIFIDPFFHFHKPLKFIDYNITNEVYQNPGIAKHFAYDAVITGSCLTESFKSTLFEDYMGLNAIKVSYSGAYAKNINIITKMALEKNSNVKKVFSNIDYFGMEARVEETVNPLPQYLYDEILFNDVNYALNKEVLLGEVMRNTLGATRMGIGTTSFDVAYNRAVYHTFSKEATLNDYSKTSGKENFAFAATDLMARVEQNLNINVLPLIKEFPDVEFIFYFPPYSMLFWHNRINQGYFDETLKELKFINEALLNYENVEIYFFQNTEEIVTDLNNYKDYIHYKTEISDYITECFANGKHRLTKENYIDEIEKMKILALDFDYDEFLIED